MRVNLSAVAERLKVWTERQKPKAAEPEPVIWFMHDCMTESEWRSSAS